MILFINNWLYIPLNLLAMANLSTFSSTTMISNNVVFVIPLPTLFALFKPTDNNTSTSPIMNIMAARHQIIMWGNNILYSLSFLCCFLLFWRSKEYEPNQRGWVTISNGFTMHSKSSTIFFILTASHSISIIVNVYRKEPWKKPLSSNVALTLWLLLCLPLILIGYFRQHWLGFMHLTPIGNQLATKILLTMGVTFGISRIFTVLTNQHFDEKELPS